MAVGEMNKGIECLECATKNYKESGGRCLTGLGSKRGSLV